MKIGIFGGTFDPPHIGHRSVIELALNKREYDHVYVCPCESNPLENKDPVDYNQRVAMCRMAFGPMKNVTVIGYFPYTYFFDLMSAMLIKIEKDGFMAEDTKVRIMVGSDEYRVRTKWRSYDAIKNVARFDRFSRRGKESSTNIRNDFQGFKEHLEPAVQRFIEKEGLYHVV